MLASILRLEDLLKCDLCDNLLRSTRTLNECGHRFCETCIYDLLGRNRQCPKCHIPAIVKNLRRDPMHDTMIACVKKLKHCMMESDVPSLSMPFFDSDVMNNNSSNNESHSQTWLPSQQPTSSSLLSLENGNDSTGLFNPLPPPVSNSYDSDATTQSSQHLMAMSYHHQTTTNNDRPPPKLQYTPSADDLLLAMEDEEVVEDDLSDNDMPTIGSTSTTPVTNRIQNNNDTSTNLLSPSPAAPATPKQSNDIYSNPNDLLAAMESEDVVMNDDDDDDLTSVPASLSNNVSIHQHDIPSTSQRRCLSNNTYANEQEPTTKHLKIDPIPNDDSSFAVPYPRSTLDINNHQEQSLLWQCTACLYKENKMDQLVCDICRTGRPDDVAMVSATAMIDDDTTTASVPPTLDSSMPPEFVIPSSVPNEVLHQLKEVNGPNQDMVVRMMVTALTTEDDVKLDITMAKAIDTCLKMEIYSDTRDVDNVTHLITSVNEQGLCTRTIKYLFCIMTGKWIVDTSWLIDSVQAGHWLPEEKYQVIGDKTSGVTHGPKRGRLRQQQQQDDTIRFFGNDDIRFFFYGEFPDSDTKLKLLQLVRQGGGKVISRRPSMDQLHQHDLVIIVSSLDEIRKSRKKAHAWLGNCAHVKDSYWLLDSIARSKWVLE